MKIYKAPRRLSGKSACRTARSDIFHQRIVLLSTSSVAAILLSSACSSAFAQSLIANGTTQTASGSYSTTANCATPGSPGCAGYGFDVSAAGIVNTTGPVTIQATGSSAYGINIATTGGTVNLADPTSITTSGASAIGINVLTGGTVNITGATTITTDGNAAVGINLNNSHLTATAAVTISTNFFTAATGAGPNGVVLSNGAVADMSGGGSIRAGGTGLLVTGVNTQFTGQNLDITALGMASAVNVYSYADVTLTGGNITGQATNNTINVGQNGPGGVIRLNDLSVTTLNNPMGGFPAAAAAVTSTGIGVAILNNVTITTYTDSGEGVAAVTGGTATVNNSSITTFGGAGAGVAGEGAVGMRAFDINATSGAPSTITATNVTIVTNGVSSSGLESDSGGVIVVNGGSVTTNNPQAAGIVTTLNEFSSAQGAAATSSVTATNVTVHAAGDGIQAFGGTGVVSLTGSTVTAGSGIVYNVMQNPGGGAHSAADATLNVNSSTLTGAMITDAISTSTIGLSNNTLWTMTGNSNVTSLTNNASTIIVTSPTGDPTVLASYKTLTTNNYVGQGGTISLNTYLGADGSPSDLLIINGGTATGSSFLRINNTAGGGAATTGDGILIVDAINGGTTAPGTFALSGRAAAGAFEYGLFRGGVGADATNDNWYLRSTGVRPEVPVDTVVPAVASRLGLAMLGTYSSRYGDSDIGVRGGSYGDTQYCGDDVEIRKSDLYYKAQPRRPKVECNALLWGRVFGQTGSVGGGVGSNGSFGSAGPAYSFDYGGFQAGADLYRSARDSLGLYAGAATAQSNVMTASGAAAGRLGLDAYGFGGYWTHRDPTGWYTDLVLQGDWYENIRTASVAGVNFHTQGWGITASAEAGYQIALSDGYFVIPQGQIIYQRTAIDSGADQFARITFGATDEIYGRLGGRFAKGWLTNDSRTVTTWAEANIWHQFGDNAQTTFASLQGNFPTSFGVGLGGTWAQVGLGISGQMTRNVSVFGITDYNIAMNQPGHSLGGRAGIRVAW